MTEARTGKLRDLTETEIDSVAGGIVLITGHNGDNGGNGNRARNTNTAFVTGFNGFNGANEVEW